ncbi:MAG: PepSY domain-containing protein [Beijerinckiaceae bacterium]|nr:PepSY domain-containing protein [Beijerinckiaceae bacterium]
MRISHAAVLAMIVSAGPAFAQSNPAVHNNPPSKANSPTVTQGANSFTEAQAKDRIMKAGYSSVETLTKNADGIWTGKATKDGAQVNVMLDFKGNISQQ